MVDPFLEALRHPLPRCFSISGNLVPVSIRDQMIRGRMFVERARQCHLLQPSIHPFIVIGGGAGGVTAAIFAASLGIPTVLIENKPQPFSTQAHSSRWLDPILYDFPVDHWDRIKQFPVHATIPPRELSWTAALATDLVAKWLLQLQDAQANFPTLLVYSYAQPTAQPSLDPATGNYLDLPVRIAPPFTGSPPRNISFQSQLILFATGAGPEKTYLLQHNGQPHHTRGYRFWGGDPFSKLDFGIGDPGQAEILISGSGDGALQDFLRVATTCRTTEELYKLARLSESDRHILLSAQDRAQRKYQLGTGMLHDHETLAELHDIYLQVVLNVLKDINSTVKTDVRGALRKDQPKSLEIFIECMHFSNCYSLNRYLALLVGTLIEQDFGKPVFIYKRRIHDIQSDAKHHTCADDADDCHGKKHTVTYLPMPDCRGVPDTSRPQTHEANILILRHGIDTRRVKPNLTPPRPRQLLPYYLD